MDFTTITVEILKSLSSIAGSYGMAIILLTIIVRLALWPLNASQQRSMKTMQKLQPKMKMIQERYKNDPQVMQKKMMEFYQEHKFNPMAGCLPLLIQMPIFILLYSALMSPQFIEAAGNANFLFINRLDSTLKGNAGRSYDGSFNVGKNDAFHLNKNVVVYFGDKKVDDVKFIKQKDALTKLGEVTPGENVEFQIDVDNLNLKQEQRKNLTKVTADISDRTTREVENVTFNRDGNVLIASVPTLKTKSTFHIDVLMLVALFGITMWLSQKIMMATNSSMQMDPNQAAMQKTMGAMMPIMLTATFIFIPIPAGVLIYLIVSNVIQVIQTVVINKQLDMEEAKKKATLQTEYIESNKEG